MGACKYMCNNQALRCALIRVSIALAKYMPTQTLYIQVYTSVCTCKHLYTYKADLQACTAKCALTRIKLHSPLTIIYDLHTGMYSEVCSLVAQGDVVGDQLGSGRVISQLESTVPSIVPKQNQGRIKVKTVDAKLPLDLHACHCICQKHAKFSHEISKQSNTCILLMHISRGTHMNTLAPLKTGPVI